MTIAFWTILMAVLMPWMLAAATKASAVRRRKYNNKAPRDFLAGLQGASQRANWAQQNSFEILPGYIAAVIIAHMVGVEQSHIDLLAVTFVISRILYEGCYIRNLATLRSAVWFIGLLCIVGLFAISAQSSGLKS
ncbi:MAG: MAPEG family protein [Porticoccaceae bacterium]|nr:MAPEG family protein [Porticoccaceae bacterium]